VKRGPPPSFTRKASFLCLLGPHAPDGCKKEGIGCLLPPFPDAARKALFPEGEEPLSVVYNSPSDFPLNTGLLASSSLLPFFPPRQKKLRELFFFVSHDDFFSGQRLPSACPPKSSFLPFRRQKPFFSPGANEPSLFFPFFSMVGVKPPFLFLSIWVPRPAGTSSFFLNERGNCKATWRRAFLRKFGQRPLPPSPSSVDKSPRLVQFVCVLFPLDSKWTLLPFFSFFFRNRIQFLFFFSLS